MSLTTITISGNIYVTYATVPEADIILSIDPTRMAKWNALDADGKGRHLIAAANRLDVLGWQGEKTEGVPETMDTLNMWPRSDLEYANGSDVDEDTIPLQIERATILLAGSVANDTSHSTITPISLPVKRVKAGTADVEFFEPVSGVQSPDNTQVQDSTVHELIKMWLVNPDSTTDGPNVSTGSTGGVASYGTDGVSAFDGRSPYDRSRGFA